MRGEHRHRFPAGKGLIDGNRRRHQLAEAIESLGRADPDVAFAILERTKNAITRQTVPPRHRARSVGHSDQASFEGADP